MQISLFKGTEASQTRVIDNVVTVSPETISDYITKSMWSPGIFNDSIRSIKTFRSTRLLVLDVDSGVTIQQARDIFSRYAYIIATTKSHMKAKNGITCERFRVILFLDQEITTDADYKATWYEAQKLCPHIDPACKDSSRFFYPCVDVVGFQTGALFPKHIAQLQEAGTPSNPPSTSKKGQISKRAMKFLIEGAVKGQWHGERNNFVRECKQNNYTFDEMHLLFCIHHTPDSVDEFQFKDVWERGVKHAARQLNSKDDELVKIISRSKYVVDITNPDITKLVDEQTGLILDVHRDTVRRLMGKREAEYYFQLNGVNAHFTYDPRRSSVFFLDANSITNYNTYCPPVWKHEEFWNGIAVIRGSALPTIYKDFFLHLTDNHLESYEYLLDWLAVSLTGRNLTLLTAIGTQGIGKGTLGDIMQALHGESNFARVRDQVFKSQFNSPLKNKTLIYVDEIDLKTKESQDRIKDVANPRIEIEEKGIDSREYNNHANFYLSSNSMDAVRIEAGDRRFSIIQLTDTPIRNTRFSGAPINELKSPANIAALASYLVGRTPTRDMYEPFKSPRYQEVKDATSADWELYLIEDWAPRFRGQEISMENVKVELVKSGLLHQAPGRRKFQALARRYPEVLKIYNTNKNLWKIKVI